MITQVDPDRDIDFCLNIIRQSFKTVADDLGLNTENAATNPAFIKRENLLEEMNHSIRQYYKMVVDGVIVGVIAIEQASVTTSYIERVAVLPEFRHKGYGKKMVLFAIKTIWESGADTISIGIINENIRLKEWYSGMGWGETALKKFEHLPFTVCFMTLHR